MAVLLLTLPANTLAQTTTIGLLLNTPEASEGYTLFTPSSSQHTYLINNQGQLINRWSTTYPPGNAVYLLPNGNLLRTGRDNNPDFRPGGRGGKVQEFNWEGELLWDFTYSDSQVRQHHDTLKLPNGNVLILAWERKSQAEAIAAGRNPALITQGAVWPEHLVEVQQTGTNTGTIVWEWHLWDHLIQDFDATKDNFGVVGNHPERVDINFPGNTVADWIHSNGIDYNEELDQILISANTFGEIWVIDHSTTTAQAAGHTGGQSGKGGDILYRWGNPEAYRAGTAADRKLYNAHNPNWIRPGLPGEGHIMIFNNGRGRPQGAYTTVEEIIPPVDNNGAYTRTNGMAFGPPGPTWFYQATPPTSFYASFISGATRMPNGNTLICNGPVGIFFEVTTNLTTVWQYRNPVNAGGPNPQGSSPNGTAVFRAYRYPPDFPAFQGRDLTHRGFVELQPGAQFEIVDVQRTGNGTFLRWNSQPGEAYQVLHRPDQGTSTWSVIGMVMAIGTESTFHDDDAVRNNAAEGYYQVQQLP